MSPATVWAEYFGRLMRWKHMHEAERVAWRDAVRVAPPLTFWLGADGDKEAA